MHLHLTCPIYFGRWPQCFRLCFSYINMNLIPTFSFFLRYRSVPLKTTILSTLPLDSLPGFQLPLPLGPSLPRTLSTDNYY